MGQNLVNDDCSKLIPTKKGSSNHNIDIKYASRTPMIISVPAILLMIYSFSITSMFYNNTECFSTSITNAWTGKLYSVFKLHSSTFLIIKSETTFAHFSAYRPKCVNVYTEQM